MNEGQKEQARLSKLSTYRINGTWNLFEKFVIDGKIPSEALRLANAAMDLWIPWFEENHIEAPEPPDIPTQVGLMGAAVTEAVKKAIEETLESRRPGLFQKYRTWRNQQLKKVAERE
jgi:hypothetical protein